MKPGLKNNLGHFHLKKKNLKFCCCWKSQLSLTSSGGGIKGIKLTFSQYFKHGILQAIEPALAFFVGKLKSQLFNLSLILHKNQEMIFASERVLKKQPCLVSVSLKGTDYLKPIVIKEIITCYRISLLI